MVTPAKTTRRAAIKVGLIMIEKEYTQTKIMEYAFQERLTLFIYK